MGKESNNSRGGDVAPKPLHILIVEDSQNDADLIIRELKRGGFDSKWKRVETSREMEALLDAEEWDVIISDFKMPDFSGLAALQLLQKKHLDIPFIIASGTIGEETAVAVMKAGASDYIMKDNLSRLSSAVERELRESEIRKAHKKADEDLKIASGWLKLALKAAKSGLWSWNISTGKLFWSEEFYELFGLPSVSEASFDVWKRLLHPDDVEMAMEKINLSIKERTSLENEYRIALPDGQERWIGAVGNTIYDAEGKPLRMSGICMDITGRKTAEESLYRREQEFRALADNLPDVVARFDREFRHVYINPQIESFTKLHCSDFIGKTNRELGMSENLISLWEQRLQKVFDTGKIESIEFDMTSPNGMISFESRLVPEYGLDGKVNTVLSIARDITKRKKAEKELKKSSEEICDLYNNAPCGYHSLDKDGFFIQINDTELKWLGYSRDELIGKRKFTYIIPLEDVNVFNKTFPALKERGYIHDIEGKFVRKDGSIFPVLINATAVKDEKGNFICSRSSVFDMTERKRIEDSLETALQAAEMGNWDLDLIRKDAIRSLRHDQIFGYKELLPKWNYEIFMSHVVPEDRRHVEECFKKADETGIFNMDCRIQWSDKSMHWIEAKGRVYRDMGGKPVRISGVVADITERKTLEDRIRQSEKMQAIGQLAGGIAHDFNNQLAGIMGYAEMLANRLDDKSLREHAENIVRASKRASDLTRDLLAFSRKGKILAVPVNIHKEIEEAVSMLERSIDKRIEIKRILKARPASVIGDPSQLENALLNIAINARDAMPDGGEIVITTENLKFEESPLKDKYPRNDTGHCMKISISDSGIGMDQETLKHIFEPFFTTKERGKGTGMGLASVYGTVNGHNGVINVSSELGHGTVFTLYFPVIEDIADSKSNEKVQLHAIKKASIMLVDDEEILCNMVTNILKEFGHNIIVCPDGIAALEMYRSIWKDIDIVILDMIMPKMSGKDTFLALKKINPQVKVILSSGYSIDGEAQSIMDAGAKSFIQKPFNINELTSAINDVLGKG